jgi:hypothetical protein
MEKLREEHKFFTKLLSWFGGKGVIVFTMGKVGTLSIINSLDRLGIKHSHPHSLRVTRPGVHFIKDVPLSKLDIIFYLYKTIYKRIKVAIWKVYSKEIVIVTGVRDPFSRSISAFFEQSHYLKEDIDKLAYNKVHQLFRDYYLLDSTISWFDKEIFKVFGIDVYKYDFDINKGFCVIKKGKVRLFIYRLDKLNTLEVELKRFLSLDDFELHNTNIRSNNPDESLKQNNYNKLKKQYKFSKMEFNNISRSKFMVHFFTKKEIEGLRKKWTNEYKKND